MASYQNGLRIVQDAVRCHNEFSGNAAANSMFVLAKEIDCFADVMEGIIKKGSFA